MQRTLGVCLAAVVLVTACAPASQRGATPSASPSGSHDVQLVPAPIDGLEVATLESAPPRYVANIKAGLPSGCAKQGTSAVNRSGEVITITVLNTMPTGNVACTMIYGSYELNLDLGSDFQRGTTYAVKVNDKTTTFLAGGRAADPRWNEPPVTATDPAALAGQLVAAEAAIHNPTVIGPELAWNAHLQQLTYRRVVERPEWRSAFLAAMPVELRAAATANIEAGADLRSLVNPGSTLPPWRIVEPAPLDQLLRYYHEAEVEFGVPWAYLAAIHLVETRMGRIRGNSTAGAQGPMQFLPSTWAAYGSGDINDNRDAIRAAARYLKANGAPGNLPNALFQYNHAQSYVRAVTNYAKNMQADVNALRGYYGWQVYYITTGGDILLAVGYSR